MKARTIAELAVIAGVSLGCGGSSHTTGTGGNEGAGGAAADAGTCEGSPSTTPGVVRDDCGVFVSAGAMPGGNGTKEQPFQTFGDAASAGAHRIFACEGTYTEAKQVSFVGGVEIYGGFLRCETAWVWGDATYRATIATRADEPGLTMDGGANRLENVNVTAPNATKPGGSSTAVLVNGGSLNLTNGALSAGDAQDGAAGGSLMPDPTLDGATGASGWDACSAGTHSPGPMGATNTCATGGSSTAGDGGDGGQIVSNALQPAGSGTNGSAMPATTPEGTHDGQGGTGEGQNATPSCVPGDTGTPGLKGEPGPGASGIGTLTKLGYQGAASTDGANGTPGQGGGGGGGAKGGMSVMCGSSFYAVAGASGGAGGAGGCGGRGGGGGQPGGSSLALLVLDATVTLTSVTLTAGKGGNGGAGGDGQYEGQGGNGGASASGGSLWDSCEGGGGGQGGIGGPGGGGQGGHSLGVAYKGPPPTGGTFMINPANNGTGGPGGNGNAGGKGADGTAANTLAFN